MLLPSNKLTVQRPWEESEALEFGYCHLIPLEALN